MDGGAKKNLFLSVKIYLIAPLSMGTKRQRKMIKSEDLNKAAGRDDGGRSRGQSAVHWSSQQIRHGGNTDVRGRRWECGGDGRHSKKAERGGSPLRPPRPVHSTPCTRSNDTKKLTPVPIQPPLDLLLRCIKVL